MIWFPIICILWQNLLFLSRHWLVCQRPPALQNLFLLVRWRPLSISSTSPLLHLCGRTWKNDCGNGGKVEEATRGWVGKKNKQLSGIEQGEAARASQNLFKKKKERTAFFFFFYHIANTEKQTCIQLTFTPWSCQRCCKSSNCWMRINGTESRK